MQKKREIVLLFVMLIILLFIIFTVSSTTFESQPNATNGKDSYIRENLESNFGTAAILRVGKVSAGLDNKALIEFNISAVNSTNTITSAKIQVYVNSSSGSSNRTINIYRITSNWSASETTWNNATSHAGWSSAGGDYDAELINSLVFTNSSGVYYNFSVTSLVRSWLNGTFNNFGILLLSNNSQPGNNTDIASSDSAAPEQRPKIIIDYTSNAPPTIDNFSSSSSLTNPKEIGEKITFNVNWTDLEANLARLFVCNSSNISYSGCANREFCNASLQALSPSSCNYTVLSTDNRTTQYFLATCDSGSQNCSAINQSYFYMNHKPSVKIIQPNGGETLNQSQGNYTIKFNSSDLDADYLSASLYYGEAQNSTSNQIFININLTNFCTDADNNRTTANNCSYSWNTTGIYGTYFLTIIINDSYTTSLNSSQNSFNVRSIIDTTPPSITSQWIDSDISSGELINIYANVSDENINTVWVSINSSSAQINLTMRNTSSIMYNASFSAEATGNYSFKVYANDTLGNVNNTLSWQNYSIRKPNATSQNETSPQTALPLSLIRISSILNSSDPLRGVYAYLNTPREFVFLLGYSQNSSLGNFSSNESKNITWFISTPLSEANYTLNITYYDMYGNSWNSSNFYVSVNSAIGGGYFLSMSGYPEVQTSSSYFLKAFFTQSGVYANPDSISILIYDSTGSLVLGPASMPQNSTGIYTYNYSIGASVNEGQWETFVNATKSSLNYYARQFFKVIGGPFDVRSIEILDSVVNTLNISVITENTGGANKDLTLSWNLTRTDTNTQLDAGSDTFMVSANSQKTWYVSPSTSYIGQVKITFLGYYSGTEKAGAYRIFSTSSSNETPAPSQPGTGGGGGGGGAAPAEVIKKANFTIEADRIVYLAKNIEKTIALKIKNTGKIILTNISLVLDNLDKKYYTISPSKINSLKPGQTQEFKIKFLITDLSGEWSFNYSVNTNELSKKQAGKINVTSIGEYLSGELERLNGRIDKIKSKTSDKNILDKLKTCIEVINTLKSNIQKEEYINAKNNIKEADSCLDIVEKESEIVQILPRMKIEWTLIITWILISIVILFLALISYILYRKFRIMNFMKKIDMKKSKPSKTPKKENFDEKIKRIQEKLKD